MPGAVCKAVICLDIAKEKAMYIHGKLQEFEADINLTSQQKIELAEKLHNDMNNSIVESYETII